MTAMTNAEKLKKKRDRLEQMAYDLEMGICWATFISRLLKNWEKMPKSDKKNKLLMKLAKEFKE